MKKYILITLISFAIPNLVWAEAYTLTVEGLVCDFCAQGIEKKLNKEFKDQKIKSIHVDLDQKTVTFDSDKVDEQKLEKLIKSSGYNLKKIDVKSTKLPEENSKDATTPVSEIKPTKETIKDKSGTTEVKP